MSTESASNDFAVVDAVLVGALADGIPQARQALARIESRQHEFEARLADAEQRAAEAERKFDEYASSGPMDAEGREMLTAALKKVARYEKVLREMLTAVDDVAGNLSAEPTWKAAVLKAAEGVRAALVDTQPEQSFDPGGFYGGIDILPRYPMSAADAPETGGLPARADTEEASE